MKISKVSIIIAATVALTIRLSLGTLLLLAAGQVTSEPLKIILLGVFAVITTNALFRGVKMYGLVKHADEFNRLYNKH